MSPNDIAKLIIEDNDDSGGMPNPILPDETDTPVPDPRPEPEADAKPAAPKSKKTTTKKQAHSADQEYGVDKVTGQPKNGIVLYSDTEPKKPVTETADLEKQARENRVSDVVLKMDTEFWDLISRRGSSWNQGENLGISTLGQYRTKLQHNYRDLGLLKNGLQLSQHSVPALEQEYQIINDQYKAGADNPSMAKIEIPPVKWWDYTSMSVENKREYVHTFWSEVALRYIGLVRAKYLEIQGKCQDEKCKNGRHLNDLAKAVNETSLMRTYERFKKMRALQIEVFKQKSKPEKEGPTTLPKETINELININKRYIDELYYLVKHKLKKQGSDDNLNVRNSGIPGPTVKINDYLSNDYLIGSSGRPGILALFQKFHPDVYEFQAQRVFTDKKHPMSPQDIVAATRERLGIPPELIIKNNAKFNNRFYTDLDDHEGL